MSVDAGIKPRNAVALTLTIKNMPRSIITCQQKLNPSRETDPLRRAPTFCVAIGMKRPKQAYTQQACILQILIRALSIYTCPP